MTESIGWADKYGAALANQDQVEKERITGLKPIKRFRINTVARYASARRGGQKGANVRARNARAR